jgi:hypothetical protein
MTQSSANVVLVPEALETNRAGGITNAQLAGVKQSERRQRNYDIRFAIFFLLIAVLALLDSTGVLAHFFSRYGWRTDLAGKDSADELLGSIVIGVPSALWILRGALRTSKSETNVLRNPHVSATEGFVHKSTSSHYDARRGRQRLVVTYTLHMGRGNWAVDERTYDTVPDGAYARIYTIDGVGNLINLETTQAPADAVDVPIDQMPEGSLTRRFIGSEQEAQDAALSGGSALMQTRDAVIAGAVGTWQSGSKGWDGNSWWQLNADGSGTRKHGIRLTWAVDANCVIQITERSDVSPVTRVNPARLSADGTTLTFFEGRHAVTLTRAATPQPQ